MVIRSLHFFSRLLISLVLLTTLLASRTGYASTGSVQIFVNTTADEINANGNCSLREALRAANLDIAVDGCPAGGGEDTIILPAGTYTLTLIGGGDNDGFSGDLDINSNLTIAGSGAISTIIDGNNTDRVFHITGSYTVEIVGLTVKNGLIGTGLAGGGGLLNGDSSASLTLKNCVISNNSADTGAGLENNGTARVKNVTFRDNLGGQGGGILNNNTIILDGVSIFNNTASETGGGLDNGGNASLQNVTLSGNSALRGGGLFSDDQVTIVNSTITGNSSGIDVAGGLTRFKNAIVADNSPGGNCLIEGTGTIISQGNNLDSENSCNFNITGDLRNTPPLLGPLQDNQGPSLTHALLDGSPAIDHGSNLDCPVTDQRGAYRPADGNDDSTRTCDMGAYEYKAPFPTYLYLPYIGR
jgi:CSLREA domain-containing protein